MVILIVTKSVLFFFLFFEKKNEWLNNLWIDLFFFVVKIFKEYLYNERFQLIIKGSY